MTWQEALKPVIKKALPAASFEVIDIKPQKQSGKIHRLAGPEGVLAPLASHFLAVHDTINPNVDLKSWIDKFEMCFPETTSFKYEDFLDKVKPWGQEYKHRPRIYIREEDEKRGLFLCELFPEGKDYPSELLFGRPWEIISQALGIMALNRQLRRYDIGAILGYPVTEYLRAFPRESVNLTFRLKTKREHYQESIRYKTVNIPDVDLTKIDYPRFNQACGGAQGLEWGSRRCGAKVGEGENINRLAEIVAHGPTDEIAKKNVKQFLQFTKLPFRRWNYSRVENDQVSDSSSDDSYRVYGCSVSILNTKLSQLEQSGQLTMGGYKKTNRARFLLRGDVAPPEFDEVKRNLLQGQQ